MDASALQDASVQADDALTADALIEKISASFGGLAPQRTWGEFTFFYNPGRLLTRGTYFCTIKEKDGENDRASELNRPGVYRLNLCLPKGDYFDRFGPLPDRPGKGGVVDGGWDFTALNRLGPHPVYAWMGWVSVLNPTDTTFEEVLPLLELSYAKAVKGFERRRQLQKKGGYKMRLGYTILYVQDAAASLEHYKNAFGCETLFVHESKLYGEAETGGTILGFAAIQMSESNGVAMRPSDPMDVTGPISITFLTNDVQANYARAIANGASAVTPPMTKPWGQQCSYVRDIDGHLVEIATPIHDRHK